jgi:hypothetical protein
MVKILGAELRRNVDCSEVVCTPHYRDFGISVIDMAIKKVIRFLDEVLEAAQKRNLK